MKEDLIRTKNIKASSCAGMFLLWQNITRKEMLKATRLYCDLYDKTIQFVFYSLYSLCYVLCCSVVRRIYL